LAGRCYTDYLDDKVSVVWIPVVTTVCEIAISRVQIRSHMNVAISLLYHSVYCSGSSDARLDNLKSVWIIDMAADGRGVTAA